MSEIDILALNAAIKQESQFVDRMMKEISKVVVGQADMVEGIMTSISDGHPARWPQEFA